MAGIGDLKNVSWQLEIADDQHSDKTFIRKYGRNPAVGITLEEDIWVVGGKETLPTSPVAMFASCESAGATTQVLSVRGLGPKWTTQYGKVTLNGQSQAAITDMQGGATTWTRIDRAYQTSAAPDPGAAVHIAQADTLTLGVPNTLALRHMQISFVESAQQSEKCLYTIPSGKVGYITAFQAHMLQGSTGPARDVDISLEIQELAAGASVGAPSWAPWRRAGQLVIGTGSKSASSAFEFPERITELTNVSLRALASSESSVLGSFTILLVDE